MVYPVLWVLLQPELVASAMVGTVLYSCCADQNQAHQRVGERTIGGLRFCSFPDALELERPASRNLSHFALHRHFLSWRRL